MTPSSRISARWVVLRFCMKNPARRNVQAGPAASRRRSIRRWGRIGFFSAPSSESSTTCRTPAARAASMAGLTCRLVSEMAGGRTRNSRSTPSNAPRHVSGRRKSKRTGVSNPSADGGQAAGFRSATRKGTPRSRSTRTTPDPTLPVAPVTRMAPTASLRYDGSSGRVHPFGSANAPVIAAAISSSRSIDVPGMPGIEPIASSGVDRGRDRRADASCRAGGEASWLSAIRSNTDRLRSVCCPQPLSGFNPRRCALDCPQPAPRHVRQRPHRPRRR